MSEQQQPAKRSTSRWVKAGWTLLGLLGGVAGAVIAVLLTTQSLKGNTDDYAGLLYVVTVPLGYVLGSLTVVLVGWAAGRKEPEPTARPRNGGHAFLGAILPFLGIIAAVVASNVWNSVSTKLGDNTSTTEALTEWVQTEAALPDRWRSQSTSSGSHPGCVKRPTNTVSEVSVSRNVVGSTLFGLEQALQTEGYDTRRFSQPDKQLWHLAAHRPDELIEITITRTDGLGSLTAAAFVGDCIDQQGALLMGQGFSHTGWNEAALTDTDPSLQPLEDALALTDPNGWWPTFEGLEPTDDWSGCPDGTASVTPWASVNPPDSANAVFAWFIDRQDALAAQGWKTEATLILDAKTNAADTEHWLLWATKDELAISLLANFSYWGSREEHSATAVRLVYAGDCVADGGMDLAKHAQYFDADLVQPRAFDGPPNLLD